MAMNKHHVAHYFLGASAIIIGALSYHNASNNSSKIDSLQSNGVAVERLGKEEAKKISDRLRTLSPPHDVAVFCLTGSCGVLQKDIINAIREAGWQAHADVAVGSAPDGIVVGPTSPEGKLFSEAFSDVLPHVTNASDVVAGWGIVIGTQEADTK